MAIFPFRSRLPIPLALALTLLAGAAFATAGEPRQLSDLHLPIGQVLRARWSPDGAHLVYLMEFERQGRTSIYSLPQAGGAGDEVLLGEMLRNPITESSSFPAFTLDGTFVLFKDAERRLASVPIGGGAQTILYEAGPGGDMGTSLWVTGEYVVCFAKPAGASRFDLYSVPLGGGSAVLLSQLPDNWETRFAIVDDDGERLAFAAGVNRPVTLFTVPLAGGTPVQVSHQLGASELINDMAFSPDGTRLVYASGTLHSLDLYSVPAVGGEAVLLHDGYSGSPSGYTGILGTRNFFFTADSSEVLFLDSSQGGSDFYTVGIDGSGKTLLDSQPLVARAAEWFPELSRLVYQWERPDYAVGTIVPGEGPGVELSVHPQGNLRPGSFEVSADASHVVYRAHVMTGQRIDLYGVPTDGSPPVLLNDTSASQADVLDALVADSRVVFERDSRLVEVPIDGGPETVLTEPYLPLSINLSDRAVYPDSSAVAYRASTDTEDVVELFRAPLGGGAVERLSTPLTEVQGHVEAFVIAAGEDYVAYRADRDQRDVFQLYETRLDDAEAPSRRISPPLDADQDVTNGPLLAAAANSVVFEVARRSAGPDEVWATTFGGEPRLLFDLETVSQYEIVPPGRFMVILEDSDLIELDVTDGRIRRLESLEVAIDEFVLSASAKKLIARSGDVLYSLPTIGGNAIELGGEELVVISTDASWVVLRDGSNHALAATDGSDSRDLGIDATQVGFSADSQHLLYILPSSGQLWSYDIALDTHRRLDTAAGLVQHVTSWWPASADEIIFAYSAGNRRRHLYRMSATGDTAVSLLDASIDGLWIRGVYFSPEGARLVLEVTDESTWESALYSVSSTGGPSTRLSGGAESSFMGFTPDGQFVIYQKPGEPFTTPLLAEPTAGGGVVTLLPEGFGDTRSDGVYGPEGGITVRVERHPERTELYRLELSDFVLHVDGFESGDFSAWSVAVP